ncbi:LysR family transcriptional regulator [Paenibacillus sp. Y412MC10]|uniref:LysR family transcriptional regulator n=1 Tax=Geobacillus sp. (strain Y412MC10) TaxID=481743 RepID=UPI0011A563F8|nr:LysR family transcriptional regulator [Paenibacillus sp. Y412MC10]
MEMTDLKVFISVAEEGGISRAAKKLDYVQSNVTARIRKLESEIGADLFHRYPKGVRLTEKGAQFRDYALAILSLTDEAIRAVQEKSHPSGPLVIGVVETVTCGNFMNVLSDFQSCYPEVSLSLVTGTSSELLSMVMDRRLDGAFVTGDIPPSQLVFEYTVKDEIMLVTAGMAGACPDLSSARWAVSPIGCPFRRVLEEWLDSAGILRKTFIEIGSLETLMSCVKSGLAFTLLPASVLKGEYRSLGAYQIPEHLRFTSTSLVRRNDRFCSKAFAAFAEMVRLKGL